MPLHDALFVESNPGPVKYAASKLGLCNGETRLPLAPIAASSRKRVDDALATRRARSRLRHDREKWERVFRQDHAPTSDSQR